MTAGLIEHVSDTAFWIAHCRAQESARTDALFHDPLAERLAGARGEAIARAMPTGRTTAWAVAMRTCIIDDYLQAAIAQGVDIVLNLGAGLDTRPYRLDLPESLTWIEVDYAHVIAYKDEQLAGQTPRCKLERVKLDLADRTTRRQFLADVAARGKSVLVLTEGVLPYLGNGDVAALADDLGSQDHIHFWIVDYMSRAIKKYRARMAKRSMQNAPFKFDPEDWFGFFAQHGWRCADMRYFYQESVKRGRPLNLPRAIRLMWRLRWWLASPQKREAMSKFAGFALLVPHAE